MDSNSTDQTTNPVDSGPKIQQDQSSTSLDLQSTSNPDHSDGFTEATMVWSKDSLDLLRLCRNRAYHKSSQKRRQHLPASLSSFLLREWNSVRPNDRLSAKYLLDVYKKHFTDNKSSNKRGRRQKRLLSEGSNSMQQFPYSSETRELFEECKKQAEIKVKEGLNEPFSAILRKIWAERAPSYCNDLPSDFFEQHNLSQSENTSQKSNLESSSSSSVTSSTLSTDVVLSKKSDTMSNQEGQAADESNSNGSKSTSDTGCSKHSIHMFQHLDQSVHCKLTEEILNLRDQMKSEFPDCDIYQVKKPKGFSSRMLELWSQKYPDSRENVKSISVMFARYDRGLIEGAAGKVYEKRKKEHDPLWSDADLQNLQRTRTKAEQKAGKNATSNLVTRRWKEEWRKVYPDFKGEWATVVAKYKQHFANSSSGDDGLSSRTSRPKDLDSDDGDEDDGKVKGFRKWTAAMKHDLVVTAKKIKTQKPGLVPGSPDFNRNLLADFQALYPKCMESTRSIFSRLQSVEKLDSSQSANDDSNEERGEPVKSQKTKTDEKENKFLSKDRTALEEGDFIMDDMNDCAQETVINDFDSKKCSTNGETIQRIEGFDSWSLTMIRDFIACMDSSRRKFSTLKEQDPHGNIKLVPMLLEEWKKIYPSSDDTVKSFLIRIKYLKQQKDLIKVSLCQAGLLPKGETKKNEPATEKALETKPTVEKNSPVSPRKRTVSKSYSKSSHRDTVTKLGEFRWNKSMIDDVIQTRKLALERKDSGLQEGKKLSFHHLWEEEFRKVYPNSTFTSNNLSVHFWTWRKQQQKMGRQDPLYDETTSLADPTTIKVQQKRKSVVPPLPTSPGWTNKLKSDLLRVGARVQEILSSAETPNDVKLRGFSSILMSEWRREYPSRSDSARGLNMMYSKLKKFADEHNLGYKDVGPSSSSSSDDWKRNDLYWTPHFNKVMRESLTNLMQKDPMLPENMVKSRVLEDWRKSFPRSSLTNEALGKRFADVLHIYKTDWKMCESRGSTPVYGSSSEKRRLTSDSYPDSASLNTVESDPAFKWTNQSIRDLLECYDICIDLKSADSKARAVNMAELLHAEFLKYHPSCKLTESTLYVKLFSFKVAFEKGELNLLKTSPLPELSEPSPMKSLELKTTGKTSEQESTLIQNLEQEENVKYKKDIVFRTWTKDMINDLIRSRKIASARKQDLTREGHTDIHLLDIWYEEFMKTHPDYRGTKKNLIQKFRWYNSRMRKITSGDKTKPSIRSESDLPEDGILPEVRDRQIRKDLFIYIKTIMEQSKIIVPMKLPEAKVVTSSCLQKNTSLAVTQSIFPTSIENTDSIRDSKPHNTMQSQSVSSLEALCSSELSIVPITTANMVLQKANGVPHGQGMTFQSDLLNIPPVPPVDIFQASSQTDCVNLPSHIQDHTCDNEDSPKVSSDDKKSNDTIKLPGGATLVAVTQRNVDALLKPKPVEKPHVTITIGEKSKIHNAFTEANPAPISSSASASPQATRSAVVLPINVPKYQARSVAQSSMQASATTQSSLSFYPISQQPQTTQVLDKPLSSTSALYIPPRVKARLEKISMSDAKFLLLLQIYEKARHEFIETLKMGYLSFFPFVLGYLWRSEHPESSMSGRQLASTVDLYIEEMNKGKIVPPDYLSKKPCNFEVTEALLKQVLSLHLLVKREMLENVQEYKLNSAFLNSEMCRRWNEVHPREKMTTKQLVSIHEMLTYEPNLKPYATPELECLMTNVWTWIERSVPDSTANLEFSPKQNQNSLQSKIELIRDPPIDTIEEWLLQTRSLSSKGRVIHRPRIRMKNLKLFWTEEKIKDLKDCFSYGLFMFKTFHQRKRYRKTSSLADCIYSIWRGKYPKDGKVNKRMLVGKLVQQIRGEKRRNQITINKQRKVWEKFFSEISRSDDVHHVTKEGEKELNTEMEEWVDETSKEKNLLETVDLSKDYNEDEEVLRYIEEKQKSKKTATTWTPDLVRDLILARNRARQRKREWEEWAVKKYGGTGFAYNNPEISCSKVDDLFKEEWSILRPEMAHLSRWTLIAYARNFDNLKKKLLNDNNQKIIEDPTFFEKTALKTVYFENSCLPKFDLEILERLNKVPCEIRDLIKTRQLAKMRQLAENSNFNLPTLWAEEWNKLHPNEKVQSGFSLQRKLHHIEMCPDFMSLVSQAVIVEEVTLQPGEDPSFNSAFKRPAPAPFEEPIAPPRNHLFVEAPKDRSFSISCYVNVPRAKKRVDEVWLTMHRNDFAPKQLKLDLPALEKVAQDTLIDPDFDDGLRWTYEPEVRSRHPAKGRSCMQSQITKLPDDLEDFLMKNLPQQDTHPKFKFGNINNFLFTETIENDSLFPGFCKEKSLSVKDEKVEID